MPGKVPCEAEISTFLVPLLR